MVAVDLLDLDGGLVVGHATRPVVGVHAHLVVEAHEVWSRSSVLLSRVI